jgi:hypothetical protein
VKNKSKRFNQNILTKYLVPIVLGLLSIGLLTTLVLIALAVLGVFPGG